MENNLHFGSLSPRMQAYRESVLQKKPYIDAQRALLATEAYRQSLNETPVMKRALMLKNILEKMSIYIEDESLLAGNQASSNRDAPIFPEYTLKFILDELDLFEKRDGDVFYITEETKDQLRSIAPFWEGKNLRAKGEALIPDEMQVYMDTGFFGMEGKLNAGDAHIVVDYANVLKLGLCDYERRAKEYKAALDLTKPESLRKYQFYKAVLIVIEAVKNFALR
ncbi:MAG: formate C-acetyltransferase/glycerol dehydratase family glycyl radical enzyme, partial [Oscillospiraceae bacterium]|nr:formate C-acetyltransferase/glycerol dehydratase family glycyl radical enzyme [Oscillospiraceae bacterium]